MDSPSVVRTVTPDSSDADLRAMVTAGWHSYLMTLSEHGETWRAHHHLLAMLGAATELAERLNREMRVF